MAIEHMIANVQSEIGNIPKALIRKEIFKAARYFCTETTILRESVNITFPAGSDSASIPAPNSDLVIQKVLQVDGLSVRQYSQPEQNLLIISTIPSSELVLEAKVSCRLSPTASALPSVLNNWDQALEAGALYELLKKPNKDWTDLNMAALKKAELEAYIFDAKRSLSNGFQSGSRRQRFPRFI